ncbi:hypothetical protein ACQJBY_036179 [Aegilops geniculata]
MLYHGDGGMPTSFGTGGRHYSRTPAPAYNAVSVSRDRVGLQPVAVSRDHAGSQQGGQFARPHRLTTPRPFHLSVPSQKLRSSLTSFSRDLVYINTPGRTCLHELFIEYEQVTAWVAGFLSTKWRQIITYYEPPSALSGSMGGRTSRPPL